MAEWNDIVPQTAPPLELGVIDVAGPQLDPLKMFKDNWREEEGRVLHVYQDNATARNPTVGEGFNLNRAGARERMTAVGADYDAVRAGKAPLTDKQADALKLQDISDGLDLVRKAVPDFDNLSPARQVAIHDMTSMGAGTFGEFQGMIKAINNKDWKTAAGHMIYRNGKDGAKTPYAVQLPKRSQRNAEALMSGMSARERVARRKADFRQAATVPADQAKKWQDISKETGITDGPTISGNEQELSQQVQSQRWQDVVPQSPGTRKFLDVPGNLAKAHDDVDALTAYERGAQEITLGNSLTRSVSQWQQLFYATMQASGELVGSESLTDFGAEGVEEETRQLEMMGGAPTNFTDIESAGDFVDWYVSNLGEVLPMMVPSLAGGAAGGALGALGGPIAPITVPLGALIGAFLPNMILGVGEVQLGIKERDPNAVEPGAAFAGGAAIGLLDSALPGRVLGTLRKAFGKKVTKEIIENWAKKVAEQGVKKAAKQTAVEGVKKVGKAGLKGAFTEGLTEPAQTAIEEAVAAYATGTELDTRQLAIDMVNSLAVGMVTGGSMTTTVEGGVQVHQARKRKKAMDKMHLAAMQGKLRRRDPEAAADHATTVMEEAGIIEVQVSAEAIHEYATESGRDVGAVYQELGVAEHMTEALETEGSTVIVDIAHLARNIIGTEAYDALANNIGVNDKQSPMQAAEQLADKGEFLTEAIAAKKETDAVAAEEKSANSLAARTEQLVKDLQTPEGALEALDKAAPDAKQELAKLLQEHAARESGLVSIQTQARLQRIDEQIATIDAEIATATHPARLANLEAQRERLETESGLLTFPGVPSSQRITRPSSEALRTADKEAELTVKEAEEAALVAEDQLEAAILATARARKATLPEPKDQESAKAFEDKDAEAAKGTGEETRDFFAAATRGEKPPTTGKEYVPVLDTAGATEFAEDMDPRTGHFDIHIKTSIPGYGEMMPIVGNAIVISVGEGKMLDIGGSEGALAKTVAERSDIEVEVLDPNHAMHETFDAKDQVEGATFREEAFGTKAEQGGQIAFTEVTKDPEVAALEKAVGAKATEIWDYLASFGSKMKFKDALAISGDSHFFLMSNGDLIHLPRGHGEAYGKAENKYRGDVDVTDFFDLTSSVPGSPIQINMFNGEQGGNPHREVGIRGTSPIGRTPAQTSVLKRLKADTDKTKRITGVGTFRDDENSMRGQPDTSIDVPFAQLDEGSYDVVFESMVFQFIDNDRAAQIGRVASLLTDNGLAVFQEKFTATEANMEQWEANETQKDNFKLEYYDKDTITEKAKSILEGMNRFSVTPEKMKTVLKQHFKYVEQHWDSGNFKGFVATNDKARMDAFLGALQPMDSEFSTVATPDRVSPKPAAAQAKLQLGRARRAQTKAKKKHTAAVAAVAKAKRPTPAEKPGRTDPSKKPISTRAEVLDKLDNTITQAAINGVKAGFRKGMKVAKGEVKTAQKFLTTLVEKSGLEPKRRAKYIKRVQALTKDQFHKQLPKIRSQLLADLEAQRKAQLLRALKKTLKQFKTKGTKGKLTARTQEVMNSLRQIMKMTSREAAAHLEGRAGGINDLPTPQQRIENIALGAVADPRGTSAAQLENLLMEVFDIVGQGKTERASKLFAHLKRVEMLQEEGLELLGEEREPRNNIMKKIVEQWEGRMVGWNEVWHGKLLRVMQSKDGARVKAFADEMRLFAEARAYDRGKIAMTERLLELVRKRIPSMTERQFTKMLMEGSTKVVKFGKHLHSDGKMRTIEMTRAELRQRVMEMRNDKLREQAMSEHGNAYTPGIVVALEAELTETDHYLIEAQLEFHNEYYERIAEAYEKAFGIPLPRIDVYVPIRREILPGKGAETEFLQAVFFHGGGTPGSLKERVDSTRPLLPANDLYRWASHMQQMEYFISHYEKVKLMRDVFDGPMLSRIRKNYGDEFHKTITNDLEWFANRQVSSSATGESTIVALNRKFSFAQLGFKAQIGLKQLASFAAYAESVSVPRFMVGVAKTMANPIKAARFMTKHSQLFRERGVNIDADFQQMVNDGNSWVGRHPTITKIIMSPIRYGDKGALLLGGHAHIQARLAEGKTLKQAVRSFELLTVDTQQSPDSDQISELQRTSGFARVLSQFMSSANSLSRAEYRTLVSGFSGRISKADFAKRMVIYHLVIPNLIQLIANGFTWDDEDQLNASLLGTLNGLFLLGNVLEYAAAVAIGKENIFDVEVRHPLQFMVEAAKAAEAYSRFDGDIGFDEFMEGNVAIDRFLRSASAASGIPMATLANEFRGLIKAGSNDPVEGVLLMLGYSPYILKKIGFD